MLTIEPQGVALTPDQADQLDAEFFRSSPLQYFVPRIHQMLRSASEGEGANGQLESFRSRLGLPADLDLLNIDDRDRNRQLAVDALSVRHHTAETLVRLLYALVVASPREGDASSVWVAVADSPTSLRTVAEAVVAHLNAGDQKSFAQLYLPAVTEVTAELATAVQVAVAWTNHALELLTSDDLSVNSGYNKVKHGLSVSARDDVRVELITAPTRTDGTIPLSAFGDGVSVPLFDRPLLTYLYRPGGRAAHLETATLKVDLELTLAEAWMIAVVAGAVFHIAGIERLPSGDEIAAYPRLPLGPTPDQLLSGSLRGYRAPVTEPRTDRTAGLFWHGSFQPLRLDFRNVTSAVITEE